MSWIKNEIRVALAWAASWAGERWAGARDWVKSRIALLIGK
jgi:hypothetical protein